MPGRARLVLAAATLALLAAGCSGGQSTMPERIEFVCLTGAPNTPRLVGSGLVPGCLPADDMPPIDMVMLVGGHGGLAMGIGTLPMPYEDADLFVRIPAGIGGFVLGFPAWTAGLLIAPVLYPFYVAFLDDYKTEGFFIPAAVLGYGFGSVGMIILGTPFWIVEKVFWDAPCAFVRFLSLHWGSPRGKVDCHVGRLRGMTVRYQGNYDREYREKLDRDGKALADRLEQLIGEKMESWKDWPLWWELHHDEFDRAAKRVKSPMSKKAQVDAMVKLIMKRDDSPFPDVRNKLEVLTGKRFGGPVGWSLWWQVHRDDFDDDMKCVKSPEPEAISPSEPTSQPTPSPSAAPVPVP